MKQFLIYGLGISGKAAIDFLLKRNLSIVVGDDNPDSLAKLPKNSNLKIVKNIKEINWQEIDCLILAAGIQSSHQIAIESKNNNCPIVCDVEILHRFNPESKFIGITGTNGKSTTTALTGHIFDEAKKPHATGGNIGLAALSLPMLKKDEHYIIETSSYQLDLINQTRFHIACLLNITPDHLDRHGNMENYIAAKKRIFLNQTADDFALIGVDNENSRKVFEDFKSDQNFKAKLIPISTKKIIQGGISMIGDELIYEPKSLCVPQDLTPNKREECGPANSEVINLGNRILKGEHNSQNICFAFANAFLSGIKTDQIISSINNFKGLRHRMQFVVKINGLNFINDSKATNAESTENALKSFENIYWILGGKAKNGGIESLKQYFPKIKYAFLIGDASEEFAKILEGKVQYFKCGDLKTAFEMSVQKSSKDDSSDKNILLSPACASFDQWNNFEERGDFFIKLVETAKNL